MKFDPCDHKIRQLVISAGKEIRKAKGLPEEKNITLIYNETAPLFGLAVTRLSTKTVTHLPAPHEMINTETGKPIIPKRDCPHCGTKESMNLLGICGTCADAENGVYKTMWMCLKCSFKDKSQKFFSQWMDELGIDVAGMKDKLGIKTVTDEGLK